MALMQNLGLAYLALCVTDGSTSVPSHIAIGTGTGNESAADTTLGTEVDSRGATTNSRETVTQTNDTAVYVGQVTAGAARSVTEAALFTASSGGTMITRGKFAAVSLSTNDTIKITAKIQFA
jgi:hypothetical protein